MTAWIGELAEGHVQEVRGEAEVVAGRDTLQAAAAPLVERDHGGQDGEQPQGFGLLARGELSSSAGSAAPSS